jgi:hypothetical protein
MATKRYLKRKRSNSKRGGKKTMKNKMKNNPKRWTTAISAAQTTLTKTGSLSKAKQVLKTQALVNARKLFGSVGEQM